MRDREAKGAVDELDGNGDGQRVIVFRDADFGFVDEDEARLELLDHVARLSEDFALSTRIRICRELDVEVLDFRLDVSPIDAVGSA